LCHGGVFAKDSLRVLHVSADYPDSIQPLKTPVIERLICLTDEQCDHRVLSLNRRNLPLAHWPDLARGKAFAPFVVASRGMARGAAIQYRAPGKGVFHKTMLDKMGDWIAHEVKSGPRPDLIVGHKLTIEGIAVARAAKLLQLPYALTIQGNTDLKILEFRRDLRPHLRQVYHEAACVFSFAPWSGRMVERLLGERPCGYIVLPCPTLLDEVRKPKLGGKTLISVFHLANHRTKNLRLLAEVMGRLERDGCNVPLQIIGGGSPADMATCRRVAARANLVELAGSRSQAEMPSIMNDSIAMVLPSRRESFGLVFLEAFFAGLPIIYPRGASVDGYFDGLPFAIGVKPDDPDEIANAIQFACRNEVRLKSALADWQAGGGLDRFTHKAIARTFGEGLRHAVAAVRGGPEHPASGMATRLGED
jgi:glycosyltransferase involved in cell wall biosynthesis